MLEPAVRQVVEQNAGANEALGSTPQAYMDAVEQVMMGEDGLNGATPLYRFSRP